MPSFVVTPLLCVINFADVTNTYCGMRLYCEG